MSSQNISKKRKVTPQINQVKFIADGVFYAELNEFFTRELAAENYAGVEVRVTPTRTEIILKVSQIQRVIGDKGKRIRELQFLVQKRFNFPDNTVELYVDKILAPGLSAVAQAESLKACYSVLRYIMESGAKGCEVVISGKLRAQRAKSMKFCDGFMIHSGQPAKDFIDYAVRHVKMRQETDTTGRKGPKHTLPDMVTILDPKDEPLITEPMSQAFQLDDSRKEQAPGQQQRPGGFEQ